jgi:molybdate transport system substrate-binding protein
MRPVECNGVTGMPEPDRPGCPETGFDPLAVIHGRRTRARPPGAGPPVARAAPWMALALTMLVAHPAPADTEAPRVSVFAAASLADALQEAADLFTDRTGHEVSLSFAGSAALARQIMLGAPADLYLSADPAWTDALEAEGLVEPGGRRDLFGNRLVLIGHGADGPAPVSPEGLDLAAVLGDGRLAIGLVEAVPAGRYGKAALEQAGLWEVAETRLAQTDNVRAALALVASGAAPAGIVYATDARAEPRVHVIAEFTADSHPPIVYPLADLAGADGPAENALFAFLASEDAAAIFEAHGFEILPRGTDR